MGAATKAENEVIPKDIKRGTFLGGMHQFYGVCKFCRQTRMMAFVDEDVPQDEVDKAATLACDCQEAKDFKRIQEAADKAKSNLRTLNEQMETHFSEEVEQMCDKAIDLIAAGTIEKISMTVGSRTLAIKQKSERKINVCIKKNIKADIDA